MRLVLVSAAFFLSVLSQHPLLETRQHHSWAPWDRFDINTNYYEEIPDTGVVREYFFNIVNTTAAPDGREREVLLVNGVFPGPTIIADWGDTVVVHVTNSMQDNGSSIHFHGVRQLHTNQMDGVTSVTQCPIAPGHTYTYTWRADEYGSSWYHSHFSMQAWEGVFGGIIVNGPSSAEYDEDFGSLFLNDWSVQTVDQMYVSQLIDLWTPQFDGGLLNGTNIYDFGNGTQVGKRLNLEFVPGKKYRLRLINASVHTLFKFSIDNHDMTIIANDFVPIKPVTSNFVSINSGQRYDVIVEASQQPDNYWFRAVPQTDCSNNTRSEDIRGIIHYQSVPVGLPTSTKQIYLDDQRCYDINMYGIVTEPVVALDAYTTNADNFSELITNLPVQGPDCPPIYLWNVGDSPLNIYWDNPTLNDIADTEDPVWTQGQRVLETDVPDSWTVLVMQTNLALAHPIHLHGHDFWVLAQGIGEFDPKSVPLNTKNPTRRDTATLPSTTTEPGYLVIAWPADNPGVWLLHCHVGFHATEGFGQQIVERRSEIRGLLDVNVLNSTCDAWDEYKKVNPYGLQNKAYKGEWDSGV